MKKKRYFKSRKNKVYTLLVFFLFCLESGRASTCGDFLKSQPPGIEGRLVTVDAASLNLNGELLGGVHYTEALANSYGIAQIGVDYKDVGTRLMVEDFITGQSFTMNSDSRLSGEIIDRQGEPVLMITRIWKARNQGSNAEEGEVLYFWQNSE